MPETTDISSTTQKFLDIYDVANDLLILKDGATALIITVNAMNFGLLAEEEQDAIIYSYASLLNSLNYPIQIVIKSQTKDVTNYLHLLDQELELATSHTKRDWIAKYRTFVGDLIRERNVLDKKFYVVIPATALEMGLMPASTVLPGVKQPDLSTVERSVILDKAREILEPKRDHLMSQFGRIGLIARQLTTQEIIQLFYLSYNPEAAEGQQITDTNSYTTPLVKASVSRGGIMTDMNVNPTTPAAPAAPDTNATAPGMGAAPVSPVSPPPAATSNQPDPMAAAPMTTPAPSATPSASTTPASTPSATPNLAETGQITSPPATPASAGAAAPTPGASTDSAGLDSTQSELDNLAKEVAANPSAMNTGVAAPSTPPVSGATPGADSSPAA